ncbi:hypothetical protein IE980_26950 [Klebsiella pneumoniae]|uniref:Uncharacterized protein n=1 Tax=Klebsiella pneumoniae TaxID=573 RepID=A0A927E489_KLEPN|nr:hypothetical protein [Klebsiella pneumoniae]
MFWLVFLSGTFVLNLRQVTQAVRFENPASDMSFIYNVRDTTKTSQQKPAANGGGSGQEQRLVLRNN